MRIALALTCAVALWVGPAFAGTTSAAPKMGKAPAMTSAALIAKGKAIVTSTPCTGCHGADLAGRKGFSPSLHASGVLKEYNPKTWAVVLDTGITKDGTPVKKPMPTYHMKAADSAAVWAYLKSLK